MKTAIYIEDGVVQLVITPESDFEKNALRAFQEKSHEMKIMSGSFYGCQGGWIRHKEIYRSLGGMGDYNDRSIIVVMKAEVVLPS